MPLIKMQNQQTMNQDTNNKEEKIMHTETNDTEQQIMNQDTSNEKGKIMDTETKNSDGIPKLSFDETADKIATINKNNLSNAFEIGDLLLSFEENNGKKERNRLIKDKRVCIRRTQAEKMIRASKYRRQKIKSCQPTDIIENLGIEKIDCICKLSDTDRCTELENYLSDNDISVKRLRQTVKIMNQDNTVDVETACRQAEQIIAEAKEQKKIAQTEYAELQEELRLKDERIKQLELKLQKYELQPNNTNKAEIVTVETNENLSETVVQEQTESLSREIDDNNDSDDSINITDDVKQITKEDKIKEFA